MFWNRATLCWCHETIFSSVKLCFKFVELYSEFFIYLLVFPPFCYTKSLVALAHRTSKKISITNRRFARLTLLNLTGILHGRHSSATEFSSALLNFYLQRHSSLVTQHKKERRITVDIIDIWLFFIMD